MKNIFEIYKKINRLFSKLYNAGITLEALGEIEQDLEEFILDSFNIPEDKTSEEGIDAFCRDYYYEKFDDFGEGLITQKELEKELKEFFEGGAEKELSFGEKAVGLSFNPSGLSQVELVKKHYADIIDVLNDLRNSSESSEVKRLCSVAITEAQAAQMWAVKAITWKD